MGKDRLGRILIVIGLVCFFLPCSPKASRSVEFRSEIYGADVERFLEQGGLVPGIAVESYLDGVFFDSVGIVWVNIEGRKIRRVMLNFHGFGGETGDILLDEFHISEVKTFGSDVIKVKGITDQGYDFFGDCSIQGDRLIFDLVIQGRGRVEIKALGPTGASLIKKKHLQNLNLGLYNKGLGSN